MSGRSQRHLRDIVGVNSHGVTNGPSRITNPTVAGTTTSGQTLTGTNGTFTTILNGGTITITRAWLRDGVPISGATGATYVLQAADIGKRIRFRNIATPGNRNFRPTVVDSAPTAVVA